MVKRQKNKNFPFYKNFTSESVCAGHPDKICDQISDAILDAVLALDPQGRVAVEAMVTANRVVVAGEVTAAAAALARIDLKQVAAEQIKRLGYTDTAFNFTHQSPIEVYIHEQSPDIAAGVDNEGAGDQGMMFGYACCETPELMPLPIMLAHKLTQAMDGVRTTGVLPYLRPDGKSQVTVNYKGGWPVGVSKVVLAVPHREDVEVEQVRRDLHVEVVKKVLGEYEQRIPEKELIVNGTGVWHIGGPASDTGVTGRKIVVDGYGGMARVGGGAFSGKDPTKVDRSGAYAARYLAKNIVAHGLADRVEVGLAYVIGRKRPLMEEIETFGTARVSKKALREFAGQLLDTSVRGIIEGLDLRRPLYLKTASYGHFGREGFPWEQMPGVQVGVTP